MGGAFWSRDVAHHSRGCSCLVALRDGRCDKDDTTLTVIGEAQVAACRLSFEGAQLLRRAMR